MNITDLRNLVHDTVPCYKFDQSTSITKEMLLELINYARFAPSSGNKQMLRYIISNSKKLNEKIFNSVVWSNSNLDAITPKEGEKPSCYIIMLTEQTALKQTEIDLGAAVQTILLAATHNKLGSCMLTSFQREKLHKILNISKDYYIMLIIAIGKPLNQKNKNDFLSSDAHNSSISESRLEGHSNKTLLEIEDIVIKIFE